jgi:hypothetical protein
MEKDMQVIWVKSEPEYFSIQGWTLICCVARRARFRVSRANSMLDSRFQKDNDRYHFDPGGNVKTCVRP